MTTRIAMYVLAAFLVGIFIGYFSGYDTGFSEAIRAVAAAAA